MQQLKYATDEDFLQAGLSRPEIRRLRKIFHKHCPQNYLYKFKNVSKEGTRSYLSILFWNPSCIDMQLFRMYMNHGSGSHIVLPTGGGRVLTFITRQMKLSLQMS